MDDIEMVQDPDPIKASYEVYIQPQISNDRQMYILQFPNRDPRQPYTTEHHTKPLKMRVKPHVGMVELDVPMDTSHNYDKLKGFKWGNAINKSNLAKNGGSHGLPGGFGIGGSLANPRGRPRLVEDEEVTKDKLLASDDGFRSAVSQEQVLVKQTLGGQAVPIEDATPLYMIGAFRKNQLHLTPVDQIVQMRPQFHHIDAFAEIERLGRARDPALAARAQQAQAIHMTIKSTQDGGEVSTESMGARISATQSEAWKNHSYIDEESTEAWMEFKQILFVGGEAEIEEGDDDKKTFEKTAAKLATFPRLSSTLDDSEYLDTISAPSNPAKLSRSKTKDKRAKEEKGKGKEIAGGAQDDLSSSSDSDS